MNVTVRENVVHTDVLIIGGGIAGLQAAIAASANGAKVTVVEKADTRHSGCGGNGNAAAALLRNGEKVGKLWHQYAAYWKIQL